MKNIGRALIFFSSLIIFGCTSGRTVTEFKSPHEPPPAFRDYFLDRPFGRVKITGASRDVFKEIKRDFDSAPPEAKFSVSVIRISHDLKDPEFKGRNSDLAHFHLDFKRIRLAFIEYIPRLILPSGKICINRTYYNGVLRHEMSHSQVSIYGMSLEKIADISKWRYLGAFWVEEDPKKYPKNGFLYPYSTANAGEDTARMVAAISIFYSCLQDPFTDVSLNIFNCVDKKDDRYLKKVEEIHRLGLTTKKEHQKILEFLTRK